MLGGIDLFLSLQAWQSEPRPLPLPGAVQPPRTGGVVELNALHARSLTALSCVCCAVYTLLLVRTTTAMAQRMATLITRD